MLVLLTCLLFFTLLTQNIIDGKAAVANRRQKSSQFGPVNQWELKAWSDQSVLCTLYIEHDKQPAQEEFEAYCSTKMYKEWYSTPPCKDYIDTYDSSTCSGSFLAHVGKFVKAYEKVTLLPSPSALLGLVNCQSGTFCPSAPRFWVSGIEPLGNYSITEIHTRVGMQHTICRGENACEIEVPQTTSRGAWMEYWVVSSYGDESEHKLVHFRNLYDNSGVGTYRLDVLQPQFSNNFASLLWDAFPSLEPSNLLFYTGVKSQAQLTTQNHLYYLSGQLMTSGKVEMPACGTGALLPNGNATTCGEEKTYSHVIAWQNQYDGQIYEASERYGLPARVLKAIIAQESQFWPDPKIRNEFGLGCLTDNGVDGLLITDTQSFIDLCVQHFDKVSCSAGYTQMTPTVRSLLRGLVLRDVGTSQEIDLLARVLRAKSIEVGQIITDLSGNVPGQVSTYEDLWDLTIANYHAGSGCIKEGVKKIKDAKKEITFQNFCANTSNTCPSACEFTRRVKDYARSEDKREDGNVSFISSAR